MRKRMIAALGLAGTVGALALREAWQRQRDARHLEDGRDYWALELPSETVQWVGQHLRTVRIPSQGVGINLDVYAQPAASAPVVILTHGMLSYGRLFAPLAQLLFMRGYSVVCPDLYGNGFSGGVRGDMMVGDVTASLVDASLWVRRHFDGPIFIAGFSLGGAIVYAAAVAGAPVQAIACMDLFEFGDPPALRRLVTRPELIPLLPLARVASLAFGWVRIPMAWIHTFDSSFAPDEVPLAAAWKYDPLLPRTITLRSLVSAGYTPPAVPLEHNTIPTLVINQEADRALAPAVTRGSFERLGGPKRYVALSGTEHWSFKREFYERLAAICDDWFKANGAIEALAASSATASHR
jgi:alpha-beta hydrolase superfamily lysophospholipase